MAVKFTKPEINVREKLAELDKPSGIAGEAMLRAETPQEQFNLIGAGRRNLIINGAMQVAQRYGVASPQTAWNGYYADRWYKRTNGGATSSVDTVADAPSGFTNSYKSIISTASTNTSISVAQLIESVNTTPLHYGLSSAKTVTVSFWAKASIAGTYCVAVQNPTTAIADDSTRSYLAEYTISAVNTWEYKTVIISGDTTGTWGVVSVRWQISKSTTTYQGVLGWQAGELRHTANQTDQGATAGATFQITGVQLELGSVATDFEHRSYGEELALCQRYYQQFAYTETYQTVGDGQAGTTSSGYVLFRFLNEMRVPPTISHNGVGKFRVNSFAPGQDQICTSIAYVHVTRHGARIQFGKATADFTMNQNIYINTEGGNDAYLYISAEL